MKLILNNIASIDQQSEIDLSKRVLIFVGENNSSKTYIAQLIWAIFNKLNIKEKIEIEFLDTKIENNRYIINMNENDMQNLSIIFSNHIKESIKDIFTFDEFNFDFEIVLEHQKFIDSVFKDTIELKSGGLATLSKDSNTQKVIIKPFQKESIAKINEKIFYKIIENLTNYQSDFLPSTRTFFAQSYRDMGYIMKSSNDKHTLPVKKIVQKLIENLNNSNDNEYVTTLETILGGKIGRDKNDNLVFITKNRELPMFLSSSMVNQLALLYFYFKYWMREKDNFLIIDEPEMNLHPKIKIEITELLLKFAFNKNRLLLATHSSIIAKTVTNYILMNLVKNENIDVSELIDKENLNLDSSINFDKDDIGVYYFYGRGVIQYTNKDFVMHFGTFSEIDRKLNFIEKTLENSLISEDDEDY